jgi:hypothetical protein
MEEEISEKMILGIIMLAVFMVQFLVNWSVADAPFWPMLMHEAGFSSEEIAIAGVYRQIIISVVGIGTSIGLLLLNFYLGKNYRLTKASTTVLIACISHFYHRWFISWIWIETTPVSSIFYIKSRNISCDST